MKNRVLRRFFLLSVVFVASSVALGATNAETWARLYRRVFDLEQKYAVMQNIVVLDDRTLEPFLSTSLDDLVYGNLSQYRFDPNTRGLWLDLTKMIVQELGDIKGQTAAPTVWDLVNSTQDSLLKADAMIALGNMRAIEYAPDIATILRNLNFNIRQDKDDAEKEAFGAIVALDKMKESVGFEPVFFASIGWYQERVTSVAAAALETMVENPVVPLTEILVAEQDYLNKIKAFETAQTLDAPNESKMDIAVVALREGLRYAESDYTRQRQLLNLRISAINAMMILGTAHTDAPELLDKAINQGDLDEQLVAIQALGADGSDPAAEVLSARLTFYNDRQLSGLVISREEQTIVRQLIYSMGVSGNPLCLGALGEMQFADYTPSIIRLAEEAIATINEN